MNSEESKVKTETEAELKHEVKESGTIAGSWRARLLWLFVVLCLFATDQVTKMLVRDTLHLGRSISVIDDFFYITHVQNPGAAFGMFSDLPDGWRELFLSVLGGIALTLVVFYSLKLRIQEWLSQLALHMIFAGAVGNLVDRFMFGSVTDFALFKFWGWGFPAFNVADSAIVIGVFLLLLDTLIPRRHDAAKVEMESKDPAADALSAGVEMDLVGAKPLSESESLKQESTIIEEGFEKDQ
jgi:signal peptidase II